MLLARHVCSTDVTTRSHVALASANSARGCERGDFVQSLETNLAVVVCEKIGSCQGPEFLDHFWDRSKYTCASIVLRPATLPSLVPSLPRPGDRGEEGGGKLRAADAVWLEAKI